MTRCSGVHYLKQGVEIQQLSCLLTRYNLLEINDSLACIFKIHGNFLLIWPIYYRHTEKKYSKFEHNRNSVQLLSRFKMCYSPYMAKILTNRNHVGEKKLSIKIFQ